MTASTYLRLDDVEADGARCSCRTTERSATEQSRNCSTTRSAHAHWTDESLSAVDLSRSLMGERLLRRSAALCVQRWYRKQAVKYRIFGPMIFSCKEGQMADFGELRFAAGHRSAQFIRVADTTSAAALSHFLEKHWRLRRPDVLISVTGSAASLTLTAQLQRVFDRGLAQAAAMTNAWIFTGGTDSGVMRLVGEAMHKGGLVDIPLVGIAPWAAVYGRAALRGCKGEEVFVGGGLAPSAEVDGKLNPHHTHQILVDSGRAAPKWGSEIALRSRLERTFATSKGVPVVLLVVQGGRGTLDMMMASARLGSPLLVLADTGGAASAVAQFFDGGSMDHVTDAAFRVERCEAQLRELHALHGEREGTLVSFFRVSEDEDDAQGAGLSSAILGCLFRNLMFYRPGEALHGNARTPHAAVLQQRKKEKGQPADPAAQLMAATAEVLKRYRDQMQRALLLTVKWNQPALARRVLFELPPGRDHSRPLRAMLQHALQLRRVEIVRMLLERPGVQVAAVSLCQLYLLEDPYNFFRSEASLSLAERLQQNLPEIMRSEISRGGQGGGGGQGVGVGGQGGQGGQGSAYHAEAYHLFRRLVGPTLMRISPHLMCAIEAQAVPTCVDLFFWAVLMGDAVLARELWARVDHPLHCALLAAHLLRRLSKVITAGQAEAEVMADEIESWATGVLGVIADQPLAHWLLSQRVAAWRLGSLISLALQMELKAFLAHRHCQSLMDLRWRGGFPDSVVVIQSTHGLGRLFLWSFVAPFANPYLQGPKPERRARRRRKREQIALGASANVLALMAEAEAEAEEEEEEEVVVGWGGDRPRTPLEKDQVQSRAPLYLTSSCPLLASCLPDHGSRPSPPSVASRACYSARWPKHCSSGGKRRPAPHSRASRRAFNSNRRRRRVVPTRPTRRRRKCQWPRRPMACSPPHVAALAPSPQDPFPIASRCRRRAARAARAA